MVYSQHPLSHQEFPTVTPARHWCRLARALASTLGPKSNGLPGRRLITDVPILAAGDPVLPVMPLGGGAL